MADAFNNSEAIVALHALKKLEVNVLFLASIPRFDIFKLMSVA